jgi:autotransporter-associated beta strand protein
MLPSKSTSRVAFRLARFVSNGAAAILLLILLAPSPVRAQTEVWTGLSDSNWSNPLNWNPDTAYPNNTDAVAEFTTENGGQIYQIGLGGDIAVGTLDLDSSDFYTIGNPSDSYALTFSASSGSASLNSGANNPTVPQTINAPLMLNSDLNINLSNTVAFNGSITGDFGVVLSGIGDLVLNAAMNVTKGFTIGKDDNTPANVTLSNMERLGSGPLTVNKMGVLDVNGQQGNGFPTVPSISGSGSVTSSAAGGSFTVNNTLGSTFSGQFTGSLDLFKLGTGTLTLGGQSSYTGMTSIGGGTVKAGANNCLPTGTTLSIASLAPAPNSVFDLNGFNQTIAGIASTTGGGVITNSNNAGNATTFTMTNATGTIGASFQGNLNLVTGGSGTLTLAPVNTYTGGTIVTDGTLQLAPRGASAPANPNALPATTALGLLPGTTLDCNGNNVTVTGISGDNSTQIVNSSTLFRSNLTINTPANTNSSFAGSFVSNEAAGAIVGQLAKTGSGTLVLSGAASYNGFDVGVNGGTLTYNTRAPISRSTIP